MRPDSQTSATLVVNALGNGLEEREIRGSGQVPVFGISDYKIEHVFRGGQHDNGGVPGLGANVYDLILASVNTQYRPAVLSDQRDGERHERRRDECKDFQHELPPG